MARLSEEIKNDIVLRLARYQGYSDIARSISLEYGVSVTRFQVRSYDPTKSTFAGGDKWREAFDSERHRYNNEISAIPISHQAFRLNQLQWVLDKAKQSGNLVLVIKILEQAAKEVGGILTKERTVNLQDDRDEGYKSLTIEERRERVSEILQTAFDAARKEKTAH